MAAVSRESLGTARHVLDRFVDAPEGSPEAISRLGDELAAVAELLDREPGLRRALADSGVPEQDRSGLLDRLLDGKVAEPTVRMLRSLIAARWSRPGELLTAVEELARQATLAVAERDGSLEEVEDELFRFGRILGREPRLRVLLADVTAARERREELLARVLSGKVSPVTGMLLRHAVRMPHGRNLDAVVESLAGLAASRRGRSIAQVTSALPLTEEQQRRLVDALARLSGRRVSVQVDIDPDILGGLVIRLGDEVVDGSIAGRLRAARDELPG